MLACLVIQDGDLLRYDFDFCLLLERVEIKDSVDLSEQTLSLVRVDYCLLKDHVTYLVHEMLIVFYHLCFYLLTDCLTRLGLCYGVL